VRESVPAAGLANPSWRYLKVISYLNCGHNCSFLHVFHGLLLNATSKWLQNPTKLCRSGLDSSISFVNAKSTQNEDGSMPRLPAARIENLVDFNPADGEAQLVSYTRWSESHDFALIKFTSTDTKIETIKYSLGLGADLEIELLAIESESKGVAHGENLRTGYESFDIPIRISDATEFAAHIISALHSQMSDFDTQINELAEAIKGDKWEAKRGQPGPDRQYAILAKLFVTLQKYSWESALVRFADLLEVPYETAKTRLRTAKDRGLLTSPGMGSTNSQLTDKAKDLTS
jgi:hypothetical protein